MSVGSVCLWLCVWSVQCVRVCDGMQAVGGSSGIPFLVLMNNCGNRECVSVCVCVCVCVSEVTRPHYT